MRITEKLELARRELLDMGLRANPLLNYRNNSKTVEVVDERSLHIYDLLVQQGKVLRFLPLPDEYVQQETEAPADPEGSPPPLPPLEIYLAEQKGELRHSDTDLQTRLPAEKLDVALLKIETDAHTLLVEQGIEVLYLALGFLRWVEPAQPDKPRFAPLLLVPVELRRSTAREVFTLAFTQGDLGANLALATKLKGEYGILLPSFEAMLEDEKPDLNEYYRSVAQAIEGKTGWQVEPDKIALGLFSFGKFQMYMDLEETTWPDSLPLTRRPLLTQLFDSGFLQDAEPLNALSDHPLRNHPETLHLVKDADSSQTEAVLSVMLGSSLVIQGPPGTGKSQTITNLISEALANGKKVLFVAQKMAALEVVKKRLEDCHLGHAILEIHSHKSTKKDVLASIKSAFDQGRPEVPDRKDSYSRLAQVKEGLNRYVEAIRRPIGASETHYVAALGQYLASQKAAGDTPLPALPFDPMAKWTPKEYAEAERLLAQVGAHIRQQGTPAGNPFADSERTTLSPIERDQIHQAIRSAQNTLAALRQQAQLLAEATLLPKPETLSSVRAYCHAVEQVLQAPDLSGLNVLAPEWRQTSPLQALLAAGTRLQALHGQHHRRFIAQAFEAALIGIRQGLLGRVDKWWRIFSPAYWRAKSELKGYCAEPLAGKPTEWLSWVDDLLTYQELAKTLKEQDTLGSSLFGGHWQGLKTDWTSLAPKAEWLAGFLNGYEDKTLPQSLLRTLTKGTLVSDWAPLHATLSQSLETFSDELSRLLAQVQIPGNHPLRTGSESSLDVLVQKLQGWLETDRLYQVAHYNHMQRALAELGLASFRPLLNDWSPTSADLTLCLRAAYYGGLVNQAYSATPEIQQFNRLSQEHLLKEFRTLDKSVFNFAKESLVTQLYERLPNFNAPGEMDVLRRELTKKRRHIPIRRLLAEATTVIQQAKPVFMMSPMSVATYLPPGLIEFDLVIFDEASQIEAPDALGALARGKQVVVVGDSKQMPPTNFFGRAVELSDEEAEESATADVESILDMMLAKGAPEKMLRWHYRSRHHSLIAVSNHQFYDSKLFVFPSPGGQSDSMGLKHHLLADTTYDRGGTRTNQGEAEQIALAVLEHARTRPHLSLGVVAFSTAQRDAIMFALERLRRAQPDVEPFFHHTESGEEFFIKNLENVQGDERDVIFISIGYGKTASGHVTQSFGPINQTGGERRLNVLISRARKGMEVFSNFTAEDLRTTETTPFGVRALKVFLQYASLGRLDQPVETGRAPDSAFEQDVAVAIRSLGYEVEPQVGTSGFFIDLAVRHPDRPGQYMLAVECDGASYHSTPSARDRDRIRQSVLEGLGWRFHRIWSTDWFRNAKSETERLHKALEAAAHDNPPGQTTPASPVILSSPGHSIARAEPTSPVASVLPKYEWVEPSRLGIHRVDDIDQIPVQKLESAILALVEQEAPIHLKLVIDRISGAAGFTRAGAKIKHRIEEVVRTLGWRNRIRYNDPFLFHADDRPLRLRDWSELESGMRKPDYLCDEELKLAISLSVKDALSIDHEDAINAALMLIGFKRVTAPYREKAVSLIHQMLEAGQLEEVNGRLKIPQG